MQEFLSVSYAMTMLRYEALKRGQKRKVYYNICKTKDHRIALSTMIEDLTHTPSHTYTLAHIHSAQKYRLNQRNTNANQTQTKRNPNATQTQTCQDLNKPSDPQQAQQAHRPSHEKP